MELEGYQIEKATSGQEGLDRLIAQDFDCVIVDQVMPGLNGIEVCRRIADLRRTTNNLVAVLMLTGRENKEQLTQCSRRAPTISSANRRELAVLKSRIRALLRRKPLQEENRRILDELKTKEVEMLRARADAEVAEERSWLER